MCRKKAFLYSDNLAVYYEAEIASILQLNISTPKDSHMSTVKQAHKFLANFTVGSGFDTHLLQLIKLDT